MDTRAMEDLLVCLFDPHLTIDEKVDQLQLHCTNSVRSFDEMGLPLITHGLEVAFTDGTVFQLIVISKENCE